MACTAGPIVAGTVACAVSAAGLGRRTQSIRQHRSRPGRFWTPNRCIYDPPGAPESLADGRPAKETTALAMPPAACPMLGFKLALWHAWPNYAVRVEGGKLAYHKFSTARAGRQSLCLCHSLLFDLCLSMEPRRGLGSPAPARGMAGDLLLPSPATPGEAGRSLPRRREPKTKTNNTHPSNYRCLAQISRERRRRRRRAARRPSSRPSWRSAPRPAPRARSRASSGAPAAAPAASRRRTRTRRGGRCRGRP